MFGVRPTWNISASYCDLFAADNNGNSAGNKFNDCIPVVMAGFFPDTRLTVI